MFKNHMDLFGYLPSQVFLWQKQGNDGSSWKK